MLVRGMLVWKRSLAFRLVFPVGGVVRVRFWAPGPPPHPLRVWRGPAHRRGLAGFVSVGCVRWRAWWFENWIVDASNRKTCLFSVALSRFRQTPFLLFGVWFEIDRFVIICSVMKICHQAILLAGSGGHMLCGVWCRR